MSALSVYKESYKPCISIIQKPFRGQPLLFEIFSQSNIESNNVKNPEKMLIFFSSDNENKTCTNFHYHIRNQFSEFYPIFFEKLKKNVQ